MNPSRKKKPKKQNPNQKTREEFHKNTQTVRKNDNMLITNLAIATYFKAGGLVLILLAVWGGDTSNEL